MRQPTVIRHPRFVGRRKRMWILRIEKLESALTLRGTKLHVTFLLWLLVGLIALMCALARAPLEVVIATTATLAWCLVLARLINYLRHEDEKNQMPQPPTKHDSGPRPAA